MLIMIRVRITYSKRGRGCFIPHVVIPQLIYRSGRRAGLVFALSEGFTPRPRVSLGPELPVGVVAFAEPADIWIEKWDEGTLDRWNNVIPEAFTITGGEVYEGPSLSKSCDASGYLLGFRSPTYFEKLAHDLEQGIFLQEKRVFSAVEGTFIKLILKTPFAFGPGTLVKKLVEAGYTKGWSDVKIVRTSVGCWNGSEVEPVVTQRVLPRLPRNFKTEGMLRHD
jgi:hypothetical protein